MNFRDMMKYVSGACCAAVMMCSSGMDELSLLVNESLVARVPSASQGTDAGGSAAVLMCEVGEDMSAVDTLQVTDRQDFFSISDSQANHIRMIHCENQTLDQQFCLHWALLFGGKTLHEVRFDRCIFFDYISMIFSSVPMVNLAIRDSNLDVESCSKILPFLNPYLMRTLDLSGNKLGAQENLFFDLLKTWIYCRLSLKTLSILDNDFSSKMIKTIYDYHKAATTFQYFNLQIMPQDLNMTAVEFRHNTRKLKTATKRGRTSKKH
jgi:hypothetical protein